MLSSFFRSALPGICLLALGASARAHDIPSDITVQAFVQPADQRLRLPQKPNDPSNRRISMIVQYQVLDETEVALPKIVAPHADVTGGQY